MIEGLNKRLGWCIGVAEHSAMGICLLWSGVYFILLVSYACTQWVLGLQLHPPPLVFLWGEGDLFQPKLIGLFQFYIWADHAQSPLVRPYIWGETFFLNFYSDPFWVVSERVPCRKFKRWIFWTVIKSKNLNSHIFFPSFL